MGGGRGRPRRTARFDQHRRRRDRRHHQHRARAHRDPRRRRAPRSPARRRESSSPARWSSTTLPPDDEAGRVIAARAAALGCPVVVSEAGRGRDDRGDQRRARRRGSRRARRARASRRARATPVGAALLDARHPRARAARRPHGALRPRRRRAPAAGRARRRACAVQHRRGAERSRARAGSRRPLRRASSRWPATRTRRGSSTELGRRATAIVLHRRRPRRDARPSGGRASGDRRLARDRREAEPDPRRAFWRGAELARGSGAWLLVTGSLYLVGALRGELRSGRLGTAAVAASPETVRAPAPPRGSVTVPGHRAVAGVRPPSPARGGRGREGPLRAASAARGGRSRDAGNEPRPGNLGRLSPRSP